MAVLYLLVLVLLAKIVLIDSPVGRALGEVIRNIVPPRAPAGAASQAEVEGLRREVEDLHERLDRIVEEQLFLTRLLSEPQQLALGPGEVEDADTRT